MKIIDKYISRGTQIFIIILLALLVIYLAYNAFSEYRAERQMPKYKLSDGLLNVKQDASLHKPSPKKQDSAHMSLGALAVSLENSALGESFQDIININLDNAYVIFTSDNNPEWEYLDLASKDKFALVLAKKSDADEYVLVAGRVLGIRPPNILRAGVKIDSFDSVYNLSLSPNKSKLLYTRKIDEEDFIFLYDLKDGKKKKLTKGNFPKWIDNKNLVFVNESSLQIFDSKNMKAEKLWEPAVERIDIADLSDDAKVLAVYLPEYERVSILKLSKDGDSYQVKQQGAIEITPLSMALSPDGKYLAVLTGESENWRITLYNTNDLKKIDSVLDKSQLFDFYWSRTAKILDWF